MKNVVVLLITSLFISFVTIAQNEAWERISPKPIESHLKEITRIPGTNRVMAVGSGASTLYSDDMGENWHINYKPAGISRFITLNAIHFVNQNIGYIVGSRSTILKTVDAGMNWQNISPVGSDNILDVFFLSESTGIITKGESIWRTVDGGITWDSSSADGILHNPTQLHFVNDSVGFLVSEWGSGYFSTGDQGVTWESKTVITTIENFSVTAIKYLNNHTGIVGGTANSEHYILKTIDDGQSWSIVNQHHFKASDHIHFINDSIGLSVGQEFYSDSFLRTNDGGENWHEVIPACGALHLNSFAFIDSVGFCVGDRGYINRSLDLGLNWECLKEFEFRAGSINVSEIINDSTVIIGTSGFGGGVPTGSVCKSTDRGVTWSMILGGSYFLDLQFLNTSLGFAIDSRLDSEIYITTDGGNEWPSFTIDPDREFRPKCLYFINQNIGFVGGEVSGNVEIYKTINGGINWYPTIGYPQIFDYPNDIVFIDDSIGFAVGPTYPYEMLLKTFDQGETWERDSLGYSDIINQIEFINDSIGFMVGYQNIILKTVDYGVNWYEVSSGLSGYTSLTDIHFPSNQVGYITVTGNEVTLIKTTDGGETWFPIDFPISATATTIGFFTEDEGVVMGSEGFVFKTYTGGIVDVPEFPTELHQLPILECYPNPTDDILKVKIEKTDIHKPNRIVIYSSLGVLHKSVVLTENQVFIEISVKDFENGIYYISALKGQKVMGVNKIVVVR